MQMKYVIPLVASLAFLAGCNKNEAAEAAVEAEEADQQELAVSERFVVTNDQAPDAVFYTHIVADRETGCQYIVVRRGEGYSMTPRMMQDGTQSCPQIERK